MLVPQSVTMKDTKNPQNFLGLIGEIGKEERQIQLNKERYI